MKMHKCGQPLFRRASCITRG